MGPRFESNVETSPRSAKNIETMAVSANGAGKTAAPGGAGSNVPGQHLAASGRRDGIVAGPKSAGPDAADLPLVASASRAEMAAGPDAAEPGPLPPPVWLIRNKIDLVQVVNRNELEKQSIRSSEQLLRTNKTLKTMVNSELKQRNEPVLHTNKALRTMVNERLTTLTDKNEPISTLNGLEFSLSASSGAGFDVLLDKLAGQAKDFLAGAEQALVTRARHRHALEEVLAALRRALGGECAGREDLLAEELRIASRALGRLTGRVDVEDILDVIFRDFCIGK